MAKKQNLKLAMEATRKFTLSLETNSGSITLFYAFINGVKVIQSDGTSKRTWTGLIPDAQIRVKIRVVGIDLPGTADDQSLTLKLQGGYYETEITL